MWSSWAWVSTTPTTRSGSSASQAKSGRMMSTPGWSASGKASPQSISRRAPSSSTTAQLRPISPSPPRNEILVGLERASAPPSATGTARQQADLGQQGAHPPGLGRGRVDQRRAQRAGGQPELVHGRLEQDRAGGGERPLEQGQVAQVQLEGAAGGAGPASPHPPPPSGGQPAGQ